MSFEKATCFDDLVKSNVEFLKGNIKNTPYHDGPLDDESTMIVDKLIELCKKYNVITTCS